MSETQKDPIVIVSAARTPMAAFQGDFTQIHVGWGDRMLVVRRAGTEPVTEGQQAWLSADPERCVLLE